MHRFAEIHKSLEEIGFVAEKHHLSVEHVVHMVYFVASPASVIHLLSGSFQSNLNHTVASILILVFHLAANHFHLSTKYKGTKNNEKHQFSLSSKEQQKTNSPIYGRQSR